MLGISVVKCLQIVSLSCILSKTQESARTWCDRKHLLRVCTSPGAAAHTRTDKPRDPLPDTRTALTVLIIHAVCPYGACYRPHWPTTSSWLRILHLVPFLSEQRVRRPFLLLVVGPVGTKSLNNLTSWTRNLLERQQCFSSPNTRSF